MVKYYSFAGIDLEIDIPDQWMYENDRYLAPFRVDFAPMPNVFRFEMVSQLSQPTGKCIANTGGMRVYADGTRYIGSVNQSWEDAYAQVCCDGLCHRVLLKRSQFTDHIGINTVLNALSAEHLVALNGGFIFHSSYIQVDGKGILFTAPSGTGKSTQADLWHRLRGAPIHNGDRSAVRWADGKAYACGIPFAGSSQICENVTLPLAAIVYLKQAPQTTIRKLRGAEAFRRVWEGCSVNTWDRTDVDLISETVMHILSEVPVFELACTPDESAIIALEGVLRS